MRLFYRGFCLLAVVVVLSGLPLHAQPEADGPRPGKYRLFTIPTAKGIPLYLGYFVLEKNGVYKVFTQADRPIGEGKYQFQADAKKVNWETGPYKENKWNGKFFVMREGKTHAIYVTPSTRGTNSTDSEK